MKIYGVETRKLESISLALEVLVQEVGPPDFIACDKEGSFQQLVKLLDKRGLEKLEAKLKIQFKFAVPNAHFTTGLVERRMRMIHDFLGKLDMQGAGLSVSELLLKFQYVDCRINTIPYGIKNIHTYSEEKIQNLRQGNELIMFICPADWMMFQALKSLDFTSIENTIDKIETMEEFTKEEFMKHLNKQCSNVCLENPKRVNNVKIRDFRRCKNSTFWPNFDYSGMGPILGGSTPFFFSCSIIAYILGSYHALPLNPDFWVDLRAQMIAPPPPR